MIVSSSQASGPAKVIAIFSGGSHSSGFVFDFLPTRESCQIFPMESPYAGKPQEVDVRQLKSIFFVKEFTDLEPYDIGEFIGVAHGKKVEVIFHDGGRLVGTTQGYNPHRLGFFVIPAKTTGNIIRVFVVNANVSQVRPIQVDEGKPEEATYGLSADLQRLEKRDWELWSIALFLLTGFAGGLILFVYAGGLVQSILSPSAGRFLGLMLFGLTSLLGLLVIDLIRKKRSVQQRRREMLEREQGKLAITDMLTRVYNRRYFDDVMPKELERAIREEHGLGLLLLDIDDFRRLNRDKGMLLADYALREFAGFLKKLLRFTDYTFRFGGDEFLLVLIVVAPGGVDTVESRIHRALQLYTELNQHLGRALTVSIGTAFFEDVSETLVDLVEQAEANLQVEKAKKSLQSPA